MTTPNPTPNDMPGAPQPNQPPQPNPQLQQPVSTSTPPAQPQQQAPQPSAPAPQEQPSAQPPATDDKPPEGKDWKEYARLWESRAKANKDAADKWEQEQAAKRTREEQQAHELQQERALREAAELSERRARVAYETGVLPELLSGGTEDEMRAAAAKALEWRGPQSQEPQRPQTAAVPASTVTSADPIGTSPNGIQQLTREQFVALSPAERMEAVRAGACTSLGVGKPTPHRRMGNEVEVAAHSGRQ